MKLLSVDDNIFMFLSYRTLVVHIGRGMAAQQSLFPQMSSCNANNTNLDKNDFDMFYKIDCTAAIHGRIWMNDVPN